MFGPFELSAFLIKTPLRNPPRTNMKPDVIRFVVLPNSFTKFRVGLGKPSIVFAPLNLFDMRPPLTLHVPLNKLLERACIRQNF